MAKVKEKNDAQPAMKNKYTNEVIQELRKLFNYQNPMQIPKVEKVVVSMGLGSEVKENPKCIEVAVSDMAMIVGQIPVITKAKQSIAGFKLREGTKIGCMATLRGNVMYEFMDKLFNIALPRVRDFRGISANAFDGRGNYSMGIREQLIFPEIEYDKVDRVRGMNITIVTTAKTDEEAKALLKLLGMPIRES